MTDTLEAIVAGVVAENERLRNELAHSLLVLRGVRLRVGDDKAARQLAVARIEKLLNEQLAPLK